MHEVLLRNHHYRHRELLDQNLREEIRYQLRQSRHISPLWNARQFTRDLETAYQQMWNI